MPDRDANQREIAYLHEKIGNLSDLVPQIRSYGIVISSPAMLKGYGTEGGKAASNYRANWDAVFGNTTPSGNDYDLFSCPCDVCNGGWEDDE